MGDGGGDQVEDVAEEDVILSAPHPTHMPANALRPRASVHVVQGAATTYNER